MRIEVLGGARPSMDTEVDTRIFDGFRFDFIQGNAVSLFVSVGSKPNTSTSKNLTTIISASIVVPA